MKKILLTIALGLACISAFAQQEYKATVFGAKSDGITDNTGSIQKAVDFISEKGGGTLVFYVGRYITGHIELKSNVTIRLAEAAVLVASPNIYAYKGKGALITAAEGTENVAVVGPGVIEGSADALKASIDAQVAKGYLASAEIPALIDLTGAVNAKVEKVKFWDPAGAWIKGAENVENTVFFKEGKCITPEGKTIKLQK